MFSMPLSIFVVSGPPGGHANFLLSHAQPQVKPYVTQFFGSQVLYLEKHQHTALTVSAQVNKVLKALVTPGIKMCFGRLDYK